MAIIQYHTYSIPQTQQFTNSSLCMNEMGKSCENHGTKSGDSHCGDLGICCLFLVTYSQKQFT